MSRWSRHALGDSSPNLIGFPGDTVVKDLPASAGDADSIPGLGKSPGEGHPTRSCILAWKIPWPEDPGGLQFMGSQRVGHDWTRTSPVLTGVRTQRDWQRRKPCEDIGRNCTYEPRSDKDAGSRQHPSVSPSDPLEGASPADTSISDF